MSFFISFSMIEGSTTTQLMLTYWFNVDQKWLEYPNVFYLAKYCWHITSKLNVLAGVYWVFTQCISLPYQLFTSQSPPCSNPKLITTLCISHCPEHDAYLYIPTYIMYRYMVEIRKQITSTWSDEIYSSEQWAWTRWNWNFIYSIYVSRLTLRLKRRRLYISKLPVRWCTYSEMRLQVCHQSSGRDNMRDTDLQASHTQHNTL